MYFIAILRAHWSSSKRKIDFRNSISSSFVSCHIVAQMKTWGMWSRAETPSLLLLLANAFASISFNDSGSLMASFSFERNEIVSDSRRLFNFLVTHRTLNEFTELLSSPVERQRLINY